MSSLPITVFFDFTCPFCYVTLMALQRRAASGDVEIRARALELFPAPAPLRAPAAEPDWEPAVRPRAEALGLALSAPTFRPRTRKAHEAAAFAAERGMAGEMRRAIFTAYWGDGRDIGRIDVLSTLAAELGMDREDCRIALDIDQHLDTVLGDQALAERLRVVSAPTVFIGSGAGARILVGDPGPDVLDRAITSYRSETAG